MDDSKTIEDLSEAEAKKVCEYLNGVDVPEPTKEQACTAYASAVSTDQDSCEMAVQTCLDADQPTDGGNNNDGEEDDCDTASSDERQGCTATVGELEDCVDANLAALKDYFSSASCENAGKTDDQVDSEPPAACKTLQEKCPQILEDMNM